MKYRAIVSITFDDKDLKRLAKVFGTSAGRMDPVDTIRGEMDNLSFGHAWIEQLFADGKERIARLSRGIQVEIGAHES